jgi:hypothetical protein
MIFSTHLAWRLRKAKKGYYCNQTEEQTYMALSNDRTYLRTEKTSKEIFGKLLVKINVFTYYIEVSNLPF